MATELGLGFGLGLGLVLGLKSELGLGLRLEFECIQHITLLIQYIKLLTQYNISWDAIQNIGERAPVLGSRFGTSRTHSCRFVGPLSTVYAREYLIVTFV